MKNWSSEFRWLIVPLILTLFPSSGVGSVALFEGTPQFAVFLQPVDHAGPHESFRILVTTGGHYPSDVLGRGTLRLGPGLKLLRGELTHTGHPSFSWRGEVDRDWYVEVLAVDLGSTEIRALLRVEAGEGRVDEMEIVLPIKVAQDSIDFGTVKTVRAETIRGRQRFRYGGDFLVPIDAPEEIAPGDIVERATAVLQAQAICEECPSGNREMPFVVFVGRDGRIRSSRFLEERRGAPGATPEMVQSAKAALQKWTFTPGRTRSGPVVDWVVVLVPVRGGAEP